jgi:endonuclease/exonuclease/phosphatase family metal-dependent hydrolase
MTCNVRTSLANDGENAWTHRRPLCIDVILSRAPHVVCCQEVSEEQLADLSEGLEGYAHFGLPDEPAGRRKVNAIFYREATFLCVATGGCWLSETPHVPGSRAWDSACVRLANWVRLAERGSGVEMRVVNTHLDHVSQPARAGQARVVCEDAAAYPEAYPQVLTGDMNCDARNAAILALQQAGWRDTYGMCHGGKDPGHTFHAFQGEAFASEIGKMDWVFVKGGLSVTGAEVVRDAEAGRYPSDHYFVTADVAFAADARAAAGAG